MLNTFYKVFMSGFRGLSSFGSKESEGAFIRAFIRGNRVVLPFKIYTLCVNAQNEQQSHWGYYL